VEIIPQVYNIAIRRSNVILIAEETLTLIDTGFPGSSVKITNYIRKLGRSINEISLIILTHNHPDHVGGLAELKKLTRARVALHKADMGDIERHSWYLRGIRRLFSIPPLCLLRRFIYGSPARVDIPLAGGEVLSPLGGLRVIHTPGHTPGSISLYAPRQRMLIVGDALRKRYGSLWLPSGLVSDSSEQALDSIKRLAPLEIDIICFGHVRPLREKAGEKVQDLLNRYQGSKRGQT